MVGWLVGWFIEEYKKVGLIYRVVNTVQGNSNKFSLLPYPFSRDFVYYYYLPTYLNNNHEYLVCNMCLV